MDWLFYPTTLHALRLKNASFLCGISSFHHDALMSGEHNTLALSLQDESPGWCLWADVAAKLRSLKRYSVLLFRGWNLWTGPVPIIVAAQSFLIDICLDICPARDGCLHYNVIGVVNDETVDGNQKVDERVQQITLILSTMASRMFMAGF